MSNKFVYSCSMKICASEFDELLESIFCLVQVVEAFFLHKSFWVSLRSGSRMARGQMNMADEAKLHSSIHSTFEALVVRHEFGYCGGEELGPFYWPMPAAGMAIFGVYHWFAERTSQMLWFYQDSESYSGSDCRQTTKQWSWPFFGVRLALGSGLEHLSPTAELVITFLLHATIRSRNGLLLRRIRDDTWKRQFFWFAVSLWGTHLLSFFTFPVCFKCQMTIELSMLSSSATSQVVLSFSDGSQLVIVNFWWPATAFLIFKALVSFTKLTEPPPHFIRRSQAKCVVDVAS